MKNRDKLSCALDIGSSRIKAALGRYGTKDNLFEILAVESVPSAGVKNDIVCDMAACTQAVSAVLENIEVKAKQKSDHLFLAVSNSILNLDFARGVCLLEKERRITVKDIQRAINSSVEFCLPLDRKLVEVVVGEYVIDGQKGILNPLGMFGRKIEAHTILLHSSLRILSNLIGAVEEAGYTVNELVACCRAQAEFILSPREKETGVVFFEIGDQKSSLAFYKNKSISEIKSFDAGVNDITRGISSFFKLSHEYARTLNERHFSLADSETSADEKFLLNRGCEEYENVFKKDFCFKGLESSQKLFAVIADVLNSDYKNVSVVFGGGIVLVDGFVEKMQQYNINSRIAKLISDNMRFYDVSSGSPLFLNSICACAYGFELLKRKQFRHLRDTRFLGRFFLQVKDLIEEYF